MEKIQLRRATSEDIESVCSCVDAAYQHYIARIGKPPGPMMVDYAAEIATHQVWVVDRDGEVAGILVLIPEDDYLLLDNIAVHPDAQGQGLGRALLDFADTEATRQGYAELRLYTHTLMTENIAMYRRLGWEETGRREQDGYDRVFFRRRIDR